MQRSLHKQLIFTFFRLDCPAWQGFKFTGRKVRGEEYPLTCKHYKNGILHLCFMLDIDFLFQKIYLFSQIILKTLAIHSNLVTFWPSILNFLRGWRPLPSIFVPGLVCLASISFNIDAIWTKLDGGKHERYARYLTGLLHSSKLSCWIRNYSLNCFQFIFWSTC